MTVKELTDFVKQRLQPLYDEREAAAIALVYAGKRLGMQRHELFLHFNEQAQLPDTQVKSEVERMAVGEPVQYVLGSESFCGYDLKVDSCVLIPRPETEELVMMVADEWKGRGPYVWDVGTGSGCIAVALAGILPHAKVFASDVSSAALNTAKENAVRNGVEVSFSEHNILDVNILPFEKVEFDVIVSNPPYIPFSDRVQMHANVVDYEPSNALFVPDDDIFVFYRALAEVGKKSMHCGGRVYVETYHLYTEQLVSLFKSYGYDDVEIHNDINGKKRFLTATV